MLLSPPRVASLYNAVRWLRCSLKEKLFGLSGGVGALSDAIADKLTIRYDSLRVAGEKFIDGTGQSCWG